MLRGFLVALALALAVFLGVVPLAPLVPVPASAPARDFSAERALRTLDTIAAKPHRTGTPADDEVREYLVHQLEASGFDVEVQDTTSLTEQYAARWGLPVVAAHVRNVIARHKGSLPGPALMLMAHYDSRELAPGASDDGYGAATLLETARALSVSPPMKHDVLLLFTEGEEEGLLGAKAFLEESPVREDVALVLNFEARGDRGPVLMFQTSERAGALIDALAQAVPHVAATSLSQEIYRRMPNDTDLTPWLRAGAAGMNFANVDGFGRYHQSTDTVANADPATLQHHGSYALSLTRRFADSPSVLPTPAGDQVYFTAGGAFIHYAAREATTLALVAVGLLLVALVVGAVRRRLPIGRVLAGAGVALLAVVLAALVGIAMGWLAERVSGGALAGQTIRDGVRKACVAAFVVLGGGTTWGLFAAARVRVRTDQLAVGALLPWAALAAVTAVALPGASYLFVWPLLVAGAGWCLRIAWPALRSDDTVAVAVHLVAAMAALVLLVPVALQIGVAFGPPVGPALAAIGALAATAAAPAMKSFGSPRRWIAPTVLAGGAIATIVVTALVPPFDAASPRPDSLFYAADTDHGTASWVSVDEAVDGWTGRVMKDAVRDEAQSPFPHVASPLLHAVAPVVPVDSPRIGVLEDASASGVRTLRLRVTFPVGVEAVEVAVPPQAHVTSASVQGKHFGAVPGDGWLDLVFFGPPASGLELELATTSGEPVHLMLLAQTRGLPPTLLGPLGPRPEATMPEVVQWNGLRASDMTLVTASFDL